MYIHKLILKKEIFCLSWVLHCKLKIEMKKWSSEKKKLKFIFFSIIIKMRLTNKYIQLILYKRSIKSPIVT